MSLSTKPSPFILALGVTFALLKILRGERFRKPPPLIHPSEHEPNWDKVDEASWESFPASDAPTHY